jgi:hypothetical protein
MTAARQTEAQFQQAVVDYARLTGWRVVHYRPAMTARGRHVTPVAYDGAGFPDLLLVRERLLAVELKTQTGRLSGRQRLWVDWLQGAEVDVRVWRPDDWPEIERTLARIAAHVDL